MDRWPHSGLSDADVIAFAKTVLGWHRVAAGGTCSWQQYIAAIRDVAGQLGIPYGDEPIDAALTEWGISIPRKS